MAQLSETTRIACGDCQSDVTFSAMSIEQDVTQAAIAWHIHHTPLDKPSDERPEHQMMRDQASARLHAAVAALLDVSEAVA